MPARSWFPPIVRLFLIYWIATMLFLRSMAFNDPGALWHIRVGDIILDTGFMHTDPFTWTFHKTSWIPQQWLAECAMSVGHSWGGFDTLLLGLATMVAWFGAWVGARMMRTGVHWTLALILPGIGIVVAGFHFYIRPHMATFVLMGVVMGFLIDTEKNGFRRGRWLWLIPLCIVWTNLHGGVLGGLFTIGLAIACWIGLAMLNRPSPLLKRRDAILAMIIFAMACATILVNPFGTKLLEFWWSIVGSTELPKYISEHKPIRFGETDGLGVLGFGAFYLILLVGIYPQRPKVTWLLPLVWFVLACMSIRHGPLFCAVGIVAIADFFPATFWYRWIKTHGDTLVTEPPTEAIRFSRRLGVPIALVGLCLILQSSSVQIPVLGRYWARLDPRGVPIEFREVLQAYADTKPKGYPIFNDANWGGFLTYHTPRLKIYFDDRCELYRDEGLRNYVEFMNDHPERIRDLMQEWHFDRLFVAVGSPMEKYLSNSPDLVRVVQIRNEDGTSRPARSEKAVLFERVE